MSNPEFAESPAIQVKRKPKRWKWMVPGVLLAIVLVDQAWVWVDRRFSIGYDTTRITAPLDHGYPDYLAWLNQKYGAGITPANNAAPLILEIVGPGDAPAAQLKEIYRVWGIPQPVGKAAFAEFTAWAQRGNPQHPAEWSEVEAASAAPWKTADHPEVAKWIGEMGPALAGLDRAAAKPRFFVPVVTDDGKSSGATGTSIVLARTPWVGAAKGLSTAAWARALNRLGTGDGAGFQHDITMCLQFSRLVAQQPTLVEHLVGEAIDAGALQAVQGAAASELLDAKTAGAVRAGLVALGPFPSAARAVDESERFAELEFMCQFRRGDTGAAGLPKGAFAVIPMDYNGSMREINGIFDRAARVFDLPTYDQEHEAMGALLAEVSSHAERAGVWHSKRVAHMMEDFTMDILFPSLDRVVMVEAEDSENRDLALTALALREAKWRKGAFPDALGDLKAVGFDAPLDRFSGKPLIYRRKGEGYVLYSVGPDGKDNGGVARGEAHGAKEWDIVVKAEK